MKLTRKNLHDKENVKIYEIPKPNPAENKRLTVAPRRPTLRPMPNPRTDMPYTAKQNRLFQSAAHDPKIAKAHGMSKADAKRMASEGVKKAPSKARSAPGKGRGK